MRFLIIVIIGLTLSACSGGLPPPPSNTGRYTPVVNPEPKYFMTVQGYIDPQLKNKIPLKIIATYYTTNPDCDYYINKFEGVTSYRQVDSEIEVKTNSNGNFKYYIPLDFYEPGFCRWKIIDISYLTNNQIPIDEGNEVAFFINTNDTSTSHIGTINWICQDDLTCHVEKNTQTADEAELKPNNNYNFTINLRKQNDKHS